jgi:hypothetical protein
MVSSTWVTQTELGEEHVVGWQDFPRKDPKHL